MGGSSSSFVPRAVVGAFVALGTFVRVRGLGELPLHGDEYHTLIAADGSFGEILTSFDSVGSHVALPLLQKVALDLCGPGVVSFRLVALVPGLLTIFLAYPLLRRWVSNEAAALATALLAVNPMAIYYARFARGYALGLLLALVLGWAVARLLAGEGRRAWSVACLVASAALLPWVHLSTLGFVLALGLAASALAWSRSRAEGLRMLAAFAGAGVLALVLFLPVLRQVLAYFGGLTSEDPPLDWFGVPTLLAGGRGVAWAWLGLLVLGAVALWRDGRERVLLTLAAALGPLALLLAKNPPGMDYAWARYLLSPLPFLAALVAAGFVGLARFVPRAGGTLFLGLGSVCCALQLWSGPFGPSAARDGAFANTYLALHPLPAFDEPWPAASPFYTTLAADPAVRVAEVPHIVDRSVFLYRNHALRHGKQVCIGWAGELPRGIQGWPYARVMELSRAEADYIVLHKDPAREVASYFTWVFTDLWPRAEVAHDETFMRRQENVHLDGLVPAESLRPIAARLAEKLGPPLHEDEWVLVWRTSE
jgi:hypothetical protein